MIQKTISHQFETEAPRVIGDLRQAFRRLLEGLELESPIRPTELAKRLKIDNKLAWKIARVIQKESPFAAGRFVPGKTALKVFLGSIEKQGARTEDLESLLNAFSAFEATAKRHAGSRRGFELLLAAQEPDLESNVDIEERRAAYQANSYLWGIQARAQVALLIATREELISVDGLVELKRLRTRTAWRLAPAVRTEKRGPTRPLDRAENPLLPYLHNFSPATPQVSSLTCSSTKAHFGLEQGPVGETATQTFFFGQVFALDAQSQEPPLAQIEFRTPVEALYVDLLVHRRQLGEQIPRINLKSDLFGPRCESYDAMPLAERLQLLSGSKPSFRIKEHPAYVNLLDFTMAKCGLSLPDFVPYRLQLTFPPLPTTLELNRPTI